MCLRLSTFKRQLDRSESALRTSLALHKGHSLSVAPRVGAFDSVWGAERQGLARLWLCFKLVHIQCIPSWSSAWIGKTTSTLFRSWKVLRSTVHDSALPFFLFNSFNCHAKFQEMDTKNSSSLIMGNLSRYISYNPLVSAFHSSFSVLPTCGSQL